MLPLAYLPGPQADHERNWNRGFQCRCIYMNVPYWKWSALQHSNQRNRTVAVVP